MKFKILIVFCLMTIGLRILANSYPDLTEKYYSDGLYIRIRQLLDGFYSNFNAPLWYIFWLLVLVIIISFLVLIFRKPSAWQEKKIFAIKFVASFIAFIIILFNWLWGFNYARLPLEDKLGFSITDLDSIALKNELDSAISVLILSKKNLEAATTIDFNQDLENKTRKYLTATIHELGYRPAGWPRVFEIKPDGFLLRLGVLGVYWPFIGQGQVDNGIPDLIKPFTFVHEMSHAFGFTDEGSCNFLAYIACKKSDDPAFEYSADLAYFRTVASNYKYLDSMNYLAIRKTIPLPIRNDLNEINISLNKFPTWVSTTAVYDWYLKAEGIEEGIDNYDAIIPMVRAWRQKQNQINLKN